MNIAKILDPLPQFMRREKLVKLLLMCSPKSSIQLVTLNNGATLYADVSDPFPRSYFLTRSYDSEFLRIAHFFLSEGGVFFDVGANFGFCSFGLLAELKNKNVEMHLFEANSKLSHLLKKSKQLHSKVKMWVNSTCVGKEKGIAKLKVESKQLGESYVSEEGSESVQVITLDDYIREKRIEKIRFLKMDIEGSEVDALEGARKSLESGCIEVLYLEISALTLNRFGKSPEDCFNFLKELDYELFYAKKNDFDSGVASFENATDLNHEDMWLKVAPLHDYPNEYDTDILAIHKKSEYLRKI